VGILTITKTIVNKKMNKKALFLATENAEILSFFINSGLARIKGKKLKNLYQSLGCPLRLGSG